MCSKHGQNSHMICVVQRLPGGMPMASSPPDGQVTSRLQDEVKITTAVAQRASLVACNCPASIQYCSMQVQASPPQPHHRYSAAGPCVAMSTALSPEAVCGVRQPSLVHSPACSAQMGWEAYKTSLWVLNFFTGLLHCYMERF